MTREEKRTEIAHLKNEACTPKSRLMELAYRLEELGAIREANSLNSIIWKLEIWQNK